jgi:GxxExxY protein
MFEPKDRGDYLQKHYTGRTAAVVEDCVLVEAKAAEKILPIHKAQLLSYMKLLNIPIGLLINFHEMKLSDGVHRLILPDANR